MCVCVQTYKNNITTLIFSYKAKTYKIKYHRRILLVKIIINHLD